MNYNLEEFFRGQSIAVTGGSGTVGRALARELLKFDIREVRVLDNNESELFDFGEEFSHENRFQPFLCDIFDAKQLLTMLEGMDIVFHTAALKHVSLCERSPVSAVRTNIIGLQNVIQTSTACGVKRVLFTSSDKAVNPTNVMGTSKLMGERLITAANATSSNPDRTIFFSTRFGNVAGSRGSVVPLFCRQLAAHRDITLTHPDMTRFVMSLDDSIALLLKTMSMAVGGEVFVTKMEVMRIADLAEVMVDMLAPLFGRRAQDVKIIHCGPRPGEKMFEELLTSEEVRHTYDIDDFFVILPAFRNLYDKIEFEYPGLKKRPIDRLYVSSEEPLMNKERISRFIMQPGVLPEELRARLNTVA